MIPEQEIFKYEYKTRVYVPREIKLPTIEGQKTAALELLKRTVFNGAIQNFNLLSDTPKILEPDDEIVLIEFETCFESLKRMDWDRLNKLFSEDYYSKIPVEWKPFSPGMPYKQ